MNSMTTTRPRTGRLRVAVGDRVVPTGARALLWLWTILSVLLAAWVMMNAVKPSRDILVEPFGLPTTLEWNNFASAWDTGFAQAVANSVFLVLVAQTLVMVLSAPAAYALARSRRRSASPLTAYFAIGMSIPLQTIAVPLFLANLYGSRFLVDWVFGWWDPRLSLLIIYVVMGLPFNVFVGTAYFRSLPFALEEAASLDGAGPYRTFFSIMLPLARPGMLMLFVIGVISLWNETFLVLLFIPVEQAQQTLPAALLRLSKSMQYTSDWGALFAGVALITLPMILLYAWAGRKIVDGMTMGAVK